MFVANWKMCLSYNKSKAFLQQHHTALAKFSHDTTIVLCPSFDALALVCTGLPDYVFVGAQDVSSHISGAHTGEVSAQSIKEIGCSYCIIGHSERRTTLCETNELVAQKMLRLIEQNITPIVCIGETEEIYKADNTIKEIDKQLAPIIDIAQQHKARYICIAYEPVWAIGTGHIPDNGTLTTIFAHLKKIASTKLSNTEIKLLYGGSVSPTNVAHLADIVDIDGFLVGTASTDFQKFEKIVSLVCNKK